MEFVRLRSGREPVYQKAMELYKTSFPCHEQREAASQLAIFHCEDYHFDLLYDAGNFVGMILYWETPRFLYVEHFCVEPQMRGRNYGRQALELLKEKGKPVILEIDPPVEEMAERRKKFYERAGFTANAYQHIHPPYRQGNEGHLLTVMSYPGALQQEEYDAFRLYLNERVMDAKASEAGFCKSEEEKK